MELSKIGQSIKQHRKNAGLTQEELAQKIKKTESSIRKYEKGLVQIPIAVVEQMAIALGTTPFELMGADYWDEIRPEIGGGLKFIEYLESIGYTFQNDMVATEWEENPDGCKYAVSYDESPNAPCCILIKGEITSIFTNQQFKDFQKSMVESAEFHAFKYHN